MSENDKSMKLVKNFIFNDDVQHILSSINNNLMDFNILEITGMGNQEIKHSNILGWLFDDSEHNLEYYILDSFLKKVIEENRKDDGNKKILDDLQSYIYLAEKKKDITIYREKDNIDLLIVDKENKVVITIENKVDASERIGGKDGGQLSKYEQIIKTKYKSKNKDSKNPYTKYFIFLTKDLEEPTKGEEYWMKASHQMVTEVIEEILQTKKDITTKTKIIFESYVDLLKRNGIVEDKILKDLCEKIWDKEEYREAFEIIINNRPDKAHIILDAINEFINRPIDKPKINLNVYRFLFKVHDTSVLTYGFAYSTTKKRVTLYILTKEDIRTIETTEIEKRGYKIRKGDREYWEYNELVGYHKICDESEITREKITESLKIFSELDKKYIR